VQKLHLVGFSAELDGLIFSLGKGSDEFVVDLNGDLLQTIAEAERRRDRRSSVDATIRARQQARSGHASELSPRELQDRLRAGWSIEDVAREAGTDVEWVSRFAAPVRAEQSRIVDRAVGLTFDKARLGPSALPLGRSVVRNLGERGVRLAEEEVGSAWGAFQLEEGLWVVRFSYTSRGRAQEAEWLFDVDAGELRARNRLASQLGHVPKHRARNPSATVTSPPARRGSKRRGGRATPPAPGDQADTSGTPGEAAAPADGQVGGRRRPATKKAGAKRSAPRKKATAKKATAKKATAKKATAKKATAKKATAKKATAKKATAKKATAKKATATRVPSKKVPSTGKARATRAPGKKAAATRAAAKKAPAARPAAKKAPAASKASAKRAAPKEAPPAPVEPPAPDDAGAGPGPAENAIPLGPGPSTPGAGGGDVASDGPAGVSDAVHAGDDDGLVSQADGHDDAGPTPETSLDDVSDDSLDDPLDDSLGAGSRGNPRFEPRDPIVPIPMPPGRPPVAARPPARGPAPAREPVTIPAPAARREPPARAGGKAQAPSGSGRIFRRPPAPERQPDAPRRPPSKPLPSQRQSRRTAPPAAGPTPVVHGPLPPPAPIPVPRKVKQAVAEPIGEPPPVEGGDTRRPSTPPPSGTEAANAPAPVPPGRRPPPRAPDADAVSNPSASRRQPRGAVFRQDLARPAAAGGRADASPPPPDAGDLPVSAASGHEARSALGELAALRASGEHDQAASVRGRRRRRRRS
jgi:hypothetical protein